MAEIFRHFEAYPDAQHITTERVYLRVVSLRVLTLILGCLGIVFQYGFYERPLSVLIPESFDVMPFRVWEVLLFAVYAGDVWLSHRFGRRALPERQGLLTDQLIHIAAVSGILLSISGLWPEAWHLFEGAMVMLLLYELWTLNVAVSRKLSQPGLLLPLSFLMMIVVGTSLLKLPRAVPPGQDISLIDALFTMTSAVCVTGLVVRDTGSQFTVFGQTIIVVFIQLGGLGIIIFGSMLAMLLGTRLSLRQNIGLHTMLNEQPLSRVTGLVRFIVVTALLIELVAALLMMPFWEGDLTLRERFGRSMFHAVSSFCNAGFALDSDSLVGYRYSPMTHILTFVVIVLGSTGFPVLHNLSVVAYWRVVMRMPRLRRRLWDELPREIQARRLRDQQITLSTKLVLTMTAVLYTSGFVLLVLSQLTPYIHDALQTGVTAHREPLDPLTWRVMGGIFADSSFQSAAARTAGFNSMPMEEIGPAGRFVLMVQMLVGGSPGGTAGGLRTTAAALLLLSIWATMRQRNEAEAYGRQIADAIIRKAATIAACYFVLIWAGTLLLSISEVAPFEHIFFEAVSAATTTGLSLGITDSLTGFGKSVIIVMMFLGRVGPLTLLGAVMLSATSRRPYQYPHESVLIG